MAADAVGVVGNDVVMSGDGARLWFNNDGTLKVDGPNVGDSVVKSDITVGWPNDTCAAPNANSGALLAGADASNGEVDCGEDVLLMDSQPIGSGCE